MDIRLSDAEKVFIIHGVQEGFRNDGRSCTEFRPVWVERGVLSTTDGSARVRVGGTDILAGVKLEMVECEDAGKDKSRIFFHVDCSANATPQFLGKGGNEFAEEIADALHISYSNSHSLPDLEKLTITRNHYWKLWVDIVILQCGGAIVDAASIAAKAALFDTEIAVVRTQRADENRMVVELPGNESTWSLDVSAAPIVVAVSKIGRGNVVDVSLEEDFCSFSSLWVGVLPKYTGESLISMTRQAGGGSLDASSCEDMTRLAIAAVHKVNQQLMALLKEGERSAPGFTFLS